MADRAPGAPRPHPTDHTGEPVLLRVTVRGEQVPGGHVVKPDTVLRCTIVNKRDKPWTFIANGSTQGNFEFDARILKANGTRGALNGCLLELSMYPTGKDAWDAEICVVLEFSDASVHTVAIGVVPWGTENHYEWLISHKLLFG